MKRREFIALAGGVAAWPLAARGQQRAAIPRLAMVHPTQFLPTHPYRQAFFAELARHGFAEGKSLIVELHAAGGRTERYSELSKEVVGSRPDVIFAFSTTMVLPLKAATETIPIVGMTGDPIARGIAHSLARPGGNVTGVVGDAGPEIWGKRLAILKEALPNAVRIGFLAPRRSIEGPQGSAMRDPAQRMSLRLIMASLESPINELEYARVFGMLAQERAEALVTNDSTEHFPFHKAILELAAKGGLPTLYHLRDFVDAGGLMSYSVDLVELFTRAARQVAEILKGAKAGEMPFYQATTFKLMIHLKTAKALGLTMPPTLLARADEVIE